MAKFNGHKNWNHWNVSLRIFNDEGLYNLARQIKARSANNRDAALSFISTLAYDGIHKTPDGAPYNVTNVTAAMRDI